MNITAEPHPQKAAQPPATPARANADAPAPANVLTYGFEWDLGSDRIHRDVAGSSVLGLAAGERADTGADLIARMHIADRAGLRAAIEAATPAQPTFLARYRIDTPDGCRVIQDQGRVSFDAGGKAARVTSVSADVTADAHAHAHDNRRLDLLVDVMDRLPAMVMVYDADFADVRVNNSMRRILGWTRLDLEEQDPLTLWWPQQQARARARASLAQGGGTWADLPMLDRDGNLVDVSWASAALADGRRVALGIDVREQRATERRLAALERRFRTMAETVPDILFIADAAGRVDYVNERFYRATGLPAGSGLGHGWVQALHGDDRESARRAWRDAVAQGRELRVRYRLRCADGAYRWWETRARPIADPDNPEAAPCWFGAASDVDELVRMHQALEEADRQKDEFLAILGHELRNPMAPVRNAVDLMQTLDLPDPRLAWAVGVIDRQTKQMDRLLDDLLDVSRIIRGKLRLSPRVVAVSEVVAQAVDASAWELESRGHDFRLRLPDEPLYLNADPARLAQVLTNLLNNAAKYTADGGHVALRVEARPGTLELQVSDDGDGIDAQLRRRLFRTFSQGQRRLERTAGGSKAGLGMGLAIAARITELHGGRIEVTSDGPGRGATFSVFLPRTAAPAPQPAPARCPGAAAPTGLSVLVVDDHADAADGLAMLLTALGHQVSICHSGAAAIGAAEQAWPHLVLLDLGMGDMDGFETARRLRALEQERRAGGTQPMLLAAVTGFGDSGTRERGRAAGFDRHLTKPVSREALTALLCAAATHGFGPTDQVTHPDAQDAD
ncbi:ATP-binding protein [uncultured Thiohalocapsa sp.]|uniref:hybrid sensor histidine kinase/response regulator n=1 Tax=uncultured Thiohalocapsa sp. TaxID=768990 RepID=UPI0025FA0AC3|nr:ATP-binding protein [uncultured Thiohalocapsa sp.]